MDASKPIISDMSTNSIMNIGVMPGWIYSVVAMWVIINLKVGTGHGRNSNTPAIIAQKVIIIFS